MEKVKKNFFVGLINYHKKKLNQFDYITKIRLILLTNIIILMEIITPIYSQYYYILGIGAIPAATIIAMFDFIKTIFIKLVKKIMLNISFSNIYKILMFMDLAWAITVLTYFLDPQKPIVMLWVDLILGIIQTPFSIAFGNGLNNYINYFYSNLYSKFQNYRMDILAEAGILGLILSIVLSYISIKLAIVIFSIGMFINFLFQLKTLKEFKKYDFKYMYRYKKSLKSEKEKNV